MRTCWYVRHLIISGVACGTAPLLVAICFWDRALVAGFAPLANVVPEEWITIVGCLGSPIPYLFGSGAVLVFSGIVRLNTGFSFSESLLPQRAAFIFSVALTAWVSAVILQLALGRSDPSAYLRENIYTLQPFVGNADFRSFPSAKAVTATSVATAFATIMPRYTATFCLLAILGSVSSLLSASNFPSDVAGGMFLGGTEAVIATAILARFGVRIHFGMPD